MAIGFSNRFDFSPLIGWELDHVTIDKYHLMFWFENGNALLNVADRCSFKSSDGTVTFSYEIYGSNKSLNIDRILRTKIAGIRIVTKDQFNLVFENGDVLSIYDNPEFRSWWFLGGRRNDPSTQRTSWILAIGSRKIFRTRNGKVAGSKADPDKFPHANQKTRDTMVSTERLPSAARAREPCTRR